MAFQFFNFIHLLQSYDRSKSAITNFSLSSLDTSTSFFLYNFLVILPVRRHAFIISWNLQNDVP